MAVIVGAEKMSILSICLVFQFAKFISFIYLKTDVIIERERERNRELFSRMKEIRKFEFWVDFTVSWMNKNISLWNLLRDSFLFVE